MFDKPTVDMIRKKLLENYCAIILRFVYLQFSFTSPLMKNCYCHLNNIMSIATAGTPGMIEQSSW